MKNVKDELQNIIHRHEQAGSGSQLKKVQNFLRGYAEASGPIEKQQRFKDEEATALVTFATRRIFSILLPSFQKILSVKGLSKRFTDLMIRTS